MPAWLAPLAISGVSALAGFLGNRKRTIPTESTTTENIDQSQMPEYDPKTLIMRDLLMDMFLGRAEGSDDFDKGYTASGLGNINRAAGVQSNVINNILANKGLARTSVGASAIANSEVNRLGQSVNFMNQVPLALDERRRQNLLDAGGFFSAIPKGSRTTGTNTRRTVGTQTDPGNTLGGSFASLGTALAGLYGQGAFGGTPAERMRYNPYMMGQNPYQPAVDPYAGENAMNIYNPNRRYF